MVNCLLLVVLIENPAFDVGAGFIPVQSTIEEGLRAGFIPVQSTIEEGLRAGINPAPTRNQ